MAEATSSKKRYFKKEKKQLKPKRHKAKSAVQVKAEEKKKLRRGVQVEQKPLTSLGKKRFWTSKNDIKFQFPKISRFITEPFGRLRPSFFAKLRVSGFDNSSLSLFFKLSTLRNFSKKQMRKAKKKNFWLSIVLVASVVFAVLLGGEMWHMYQNWQEKKVEYVRLQHELATWENVAQAYPTYRDAYFEAAVLAYRLGKKEKEEEYLQKALSIDPNFAPALELRKLAK